MANLLAGAAMTVHFQSDEVPPYQKLAVQHKRFGIRCRLGTASYYRWYATAQARDQAFDDLIRHADTRSKKHGVCRVKEKVER